MANNKEPLLKDGKEEKLPLLLRPKTITFEDEVNGANTNKDPPDDPESGAIKKKRFNMFHIYRYADALDIFLMISGIFLALAQGVAMPIAVYFNGPILDALIGYHRKSPNETTNRTFLQDNEQHRGNLSFPHFLNATSSSGSNVFEQVWMLCVDTALLGVVMFVCGMLYGTAWTVSGERQMLRVRKNLFQAILDKDISWFSKRRPGELNAIMFDTVRKMENGLSAKVSMTLGLLFTAGSSFVTAFVVDWKISIIVILLTPLLFFCSFVIIRVMRGYAAKQMQSYGKAGSIAAEVLNNWKTVQAFNKQEEEVIRYGMELTDFTKWGILKTLLNGLLQGTRSFIVCLMAALTFWLGAQQQGIDVDGGKLLVIYVCIANGSSSLGMAVPDVNIMATASAAAADIFEIIDEVSSIKNLDDDGIEPQDFSGDVVFDQVTFSYPERPDRNVLKSLSLHIPQGQTVALVGSSGGGKSTIAQLILRLYDPTSGRVTLDDIDIRKLNVRWLRQNIGVVGQEPVLFNTTIRENISLGAADPDSVTDEQVIKAASLANAHDFISKLPFGYDTPVGERGTQLSGGQKQRIAIARALVSNPPLLILDEATSALDTASESLVQDAIDKAAIGRTTIIIAHRLSTIQNADIIAVLDAGSVVEIGKHDNLIAKPGGLYRQLVGSQLQVEKTEADEGSSTSDSDVSVTAFAKFKSGISDSDTGARQRAKSTVTIRSETLESPELREMRISEMGLINSMKMALKWSKSEASLIIACIFVSFLVGAFDPTYNIVFARMATSFTDIDYVTEVNMFVVIIIVLTVVEFIAVALQHYLYGLIGERLTARLRCRVLGKILRADAAWHDEKRNGPAVSTTILLNDCEDIQGVSAIRLCSYVTISVLLIEAVVVALVFDYRITLSAMPLMPVITFAGIAYNRVQIGTAEVDEKASKECATIAMDAIGNMRTVISLTTEPYFLARFNGRYELLQKDKIRGGIFATSLQNLLFASLQWIRAVIFLIGTYLLSQHETDAFTVLAIFMLLGMAGMVIGRHSSSVSDDDRGREAAMNISRIMEYENVIDPEDPRDGESLMARELVANNLLDIPCEGRIEFRNASFSYPTRPNTEVLSDINLTIRPGQFVAICGPSGSGKSTIVQLLERFYDPTYGEVLIDNVDAKSLNPRWLRANIGLVGQEPSLFAINILNNIAYGSKGDMKPTVKEIVKASRQANALDFIDKLPDQFYTNVGESGSEISGGQKQRIAIARALVRKPTILLLDEATSALDSESERVVQDALEKARKGRTCLVVAHRLSTIRRADYIVVIDGGRIVEEGTHQQLIDLRGVYYKMQNAQNA